MSRVRMIPKLSGRCWLFRIQMILSMRSMRPMRKEERIWNAEAELRDIPRI